MSDHDDAVGAAQPDNQTLLRDLNASTTPTAATPTPPAQGVPPWESKPSVPGHTPPVRSREEVTPDAVGTPGVTGAVNPEPLPTSGGTPGTGAYAGLTWDGTSWTGAASVPQQQNGKGTASLVIGIIAIVLCGGGFILPLLSITFGWTGMKRAKQGRATNGGVAKAGFILGCVAAGIGIVIGLMYIVSLATGGTSTTLDTSSVERQLNAGLVQELGGQYSVDCPTAVVVQAGGTFSCDVTSLTDGVTAQVEVTQADDQGNLLWEIVSAN